MEKFGWAATYLLLGAAGLAAFVTRAPAAQAAIGLIWVVVMSMLLFFGAIVAAYGVYKDYRFEAGGILSIGAGSAMYGAALWYIASHSPSVPVHTALFITAITCASVFRFLYISHVRHRLYRAIDANENLEHDGQ